MVGGAVRVIYLLIGAFLLHNKDRNAQLIYFK